MIDNLSTQSLKVLYNTLVMGLKLYGSGISNGKDLDFELIRKDIEILDIELKKREKGEK